MRASTLLCIRESSKPLYSSAHKRSRRAISCPSGRAIVVCRVLCCDSAKCVLDRLTLPRLSCACPCSLPPSCVPLLISQQSKSKLDKSNRMSAKEPSPLDATSKLPIARADYVPKASGVHEEEAEKPQSKRAPDGASPRVRRRLHGRKGQPASLQQNANSR